MWWFCIYQINCIYLFQYQKVFCAYMVSFLTALSCTLQYKCSMCCSWYKQEINSMYKTHFHYLFCTKRMGKICNVKCENISIKSTHKQIYIITKFHFVPYIYIRYNLLFHLYVAHLLFYKVKVVYLTSH